MNDVFEELDITDFKWKRVDMSFNTMDNKYYPNYNEVKQIIDCLYC